MVKKIALYIIILTLALTGILSCSGDSFEEYKKNRIVEDNIPTPDTIPPDIESITALSGTDIKVVFSEEIEPVSALLIGNYYVQGNNRVTVTAANLQDDNKSVILTLSNDSIYKMQNGKEYTLLVQRVADINGNKILNAFSTFIGRGEVIAEIYKEEDMMPSESPYPSYNSSYAEFIISGPGVSSYQYSLDESPWSSEQPISSKLTVAGLTEGFHTLRVTGKSSVSGEWQDVNHPTTTSFTVDVTPPVAILQHTPASVSDQMDIDIVVSGNGVATYKYQINSGSWSDYIPVSSRIIKKSLPEGSYTVYVRGRDEAGNEQQSDTEYSWIINASSPVAVLTGAPDKYTRQKNINITVGGNNVNFFKYRIDGGSWTEKYDIGTTIRLNNLYDKTYTVDIIGASGISEDTDGPVTTYSWTVDNTAPVCNISNLTSNPTSSQSTHFNVGSAAGDVVRYRYRINNESLSGVFSVDTPIEVTALSEGNYTIKVMGIDAAGNIQKEADAAVWNWSVDLTPPYASLSGLPPEMASTKELSVAVSGIDSIAYKYQLDDQPWSSELSVSLTIDSSNLSEGYHTLYVVARDEAGNWQTIQNATTYTWIVDTVPPVAVLTDKPPPVTNVQSADITVSGTGVARYKYRMNNGLWSEEKDRINNPSIPLSSLAEGEHTIEVLAVDAAGNWQLTPTSYTWMINTSVPTATLSNKPAKFSTSSSLNITVQSVDVYKYRIDNNSWSGEIPVSVFITETGLSDGLHTLYVMGKNSTSGLWQSDSSPTTYEWTIDTVPPVVELGNKPPSLTNNQSASFTVNGIGIYSYKYSLDNPEVYGTEKIAEENNVIELKNLSGTSHTIYVKGRDEAGNWQLSPSTYTWEINTSVPAASLSNLPAPLTNQTIFNVTVGGFDVIAYKYKYDGSAWSPELDVSIPISRSGVIAGTHTLSVIGKNSAGTWQPVASATPHTWTVNITAPSAGDITLSNLPNDPTEDVTAAITVGGTGLTHYQYRINNNSWSSDIDVSEPIILTGLGDNTYTLYVIAKNEAGNWLDRSYAKTYEWRVDTVSPLATITNRPDNPTNIDTASFDIGGAGIIEYKYRLNSGSWSGWTDVDTNINLASLADGSHTIYVCGRKAAEAGFTQADVNATLYTWLIDTIAPTAVISNLPVNYTTSRSAAIHVSGTGVVAYKYRLDKSGQPTDPGDSSWLPALSDKSVNFDLIISDLSVEEHTIEVIGRDEAGNWQAVPASHTWTIVYPPLDSPAVFDEGTTSINPVLQFAWINPGGAENVKIQIASDSNFDNIVYGGSTGTVIGNSSPYNYIVTNPEAQRYYARLSVNANGSALAGDLGWTAWDNSKASDGIDVVGGIGGRVKNAVGFTAISGALIEVRRMDNSELVATTQTDSSGDFAVGSIGIGTGIYKLEISASTYLGAAKTNITVVIGEETNVGQLFLVPETAQSGTITGTSIDANTGFTLGSSTIKVFDWHNDQQGPDYTTSSTGVFKTASLAPGVYTIVISKTVFFDLSVDNVIVNGDMAVGRLALCQVLVEPQVRFIYQWDEFPSDPDIFITGPTTTNQTDAPSNRFIVQSAIKMFNEATGASWGGITDNGDWYGTRSTTSLVQDAVTGYGPEAINLYRYGGVQYAKGTYTFTVHRFAYNTSNIIGNSSVFFIPNISLSQGSNTVTGTVSADSKAIPYCAVEEGNIEITAGSSQYDNIFYDRHSYGISGTGIPVDTYITWYDRAERKRFQINNAPTESGSSVTITLSNRIESYGLFPGLLVTGNGIPSGTTIKSITNTGGQNFSMDLSQAAESTRSSTLTFYPGWGRSSGKVRVYDSGGMVREINFPANMLSTDDNCWKVLKMNIQGPSRDKRKVIQINEFMQSGQNKASMDW